MSNDSNEKDDKFVLEIHELENQVDILTYERDEAQEEARFWHTEYDKLRQDMEEVSNILFYENVTRRNAR